MMRLLLATAAADDPPKNIVLADVGLHVIGLGYQRTVAPWLALQADADVIYSPWTLNLDLFGDYDGDVAGSVLRLRPVFYPSASAPDGLWISPFVQAGPARATRDGEKESGFVAAGGASVGYAGRLGPVHLAGGVGGQYHVARIEGGDDAPSFAGLYPTIDGTVGVAF